MMDRWLKEGEKGSWLSVKLEKVFGPSGSSFKGLFADWPNDLGVKGHRYDLSMLTKTRS